VTLQDRIARGERAIAQARTLGKDVVSWERHLATLKEAAQRETRSLPSRQGYRKEVKEGMGDDPILTPHQWYPHFRDFHHKVIAESPGLDYGRLREHWPDLHQAISAKENELDALGSARLSEVMAIIREWRELFLKAEFERSR